ncbi:putative alpha-amylase [Saitoella complicata NRRL Y-17804]|uniref:Glycosyl hydrolase family 13 catalytic domain-containing protein n=1 Tax=Saitoella complicata (strain BCRC 22490 / CBS 7301 / JCM 7358 / NBRC 10748 / NRRL Y-17804) TaxID=698492 RepID=A0A0E9NP46_SAICN|nr:putative alpha-amylase [Saitoella complicata NRRL Y-17804]ODQ52029.1 putative alpha-amylase [Saitoella complicata NRRL Y-17804]GAO51609.1 hypothetical protein G7K_5705-t1 [Saitoella complicata NRRL Y-17804]
MLKSFLQLIKTRRDLREEDHPLAPTSPNECLLQSFEWHTRSSADDPHWSHLSSLMPTLAELGVTLLLIPPPTKAAYENSNGYDVYDLWDLGEFEQKGQVGTKWGTKVQLEEMCRKAKEAGIGIIADAVLGHKTGADEKERVKLVKVDDENRLKVVGDVRDTYAWVRWKFDGRGEKYSQMEWGPQHFTGIEWDDGAQENGIFLLNGKQWSKNVDARFGNYDYLMFTDIDHTHPEVHADLLAWGRWITKELNLKGMRFDAVRHFDYDFMRQFQEHVAATTSGWISVGEFYDGDVRLLKAYLSHMTPGYKLFDIPLLTNFAAASASYLPLPPTPPSSTPASTISTGRVQNVRSKPFDLRRIFNGSLLASHPTQSVTLVANHDTQPGQACETPIAAWFKPLAYAILLLRNDGLPCVFWGDLFGITQGPEVVDKVKGLEVLMRARKGWAYGRQMDYFMDGGSLAWVRMGTHDRPGCAVVLSAVEGGARRSMFVGKRCAGGRWVDMMGLVKQEVRIDKKGYGEFLCEGRSVSVWNNAE